MNFKTLGVGALLAGAVTTGALATAPAQAATFTYVDNTTIPGGADLPDSTPPTSVNSAFPSGSLDPNGNTLAISGNFGTRDGAGLDLNDYGSFTLAAPADLLSITMASAHIPKSPVTYRELGYQFYSGVVGSGGTLLSSGTFYTDGFRGPNSLIPSNATGDLLANLSAGTYSFRTYVVNTDQAPTTNDISYSLRFDATPVPTPALLPGLIGMGVAAWRKRKGEAAEEAEAKV